MQIYSEDNGQINYNLFTIDIPIVSGQQYTFYFEPNPLTMPDPYYIGLGYPSPYGGGVLLAVSNGDPWQIDELDLVFRTWVETLPEPALTLVVGDGTTFADPGTEITININDTIWIGINDDIGVMYGAKLSQYTWYGDTGLGGWTGNSAVYSPPAIDTAPGWERRNEHLWYVNLFDSDAVETPLPGVGCALEFRALAKGNVEVYLNERPARPEDELTIYVVPEPIEASVEIKPDTLNLQSKGRWITCRIRLPEPYEIADIEPNSVLLEDEIEPDWIRLDEVDQVAVVKFSRSELQDILEQSGVTGLVQLKVTGELTDGTVFKGTDIIRVINKSSKK